MVLGEKKMGRHKARGVSKFKYRKEELKNLVDSKNGEKSEGSEKKVIGLGRGRKGLGKNKIVPKPKLRSAIISKLDNDGMTTNVDTEMVPSNSVINGKELIDSVGAALTTSDGKDRANDFDTGTATFKQMKMNGAESNLVLGIRDKSKHLKEHKTRVNSRFKKKVIESRKRGNKKIPFRRMNGVIAKNTEKPEASNKTRMKDEVKGMIFMCSSKTMEDCYHYMVLGLPPNKKDIVLKIYKGMRLFLFDIDLKLMYGIYKAAGPGGYDIEPKAFNSAFPSQVRFTILEECLPLQEKEFKEIIKDNYYSTHKFHCQLTYDQVKNLCNRFKIASKGSKSKRSRENPRAKAPIFVDHVSKRPRRSWKGENHKFVDQLHRSPRAETQTSLYHDRSWYYGWEEERYDFVVRDHLYSEDEVVHRREVNGHTVAHPPLRGVLHMPPALLPPSDTDIYRREELRYHDQLLDMDFRPGEEFEHHSSFRRSPYGDEAEHRDHYRRSRYQFEFEQRGPHRGSQHQDNLQDSYEKSRKHQWDHYRSSSSGMPPEYFPPASRGPASRFHLSAGRKRYHKPHQAFQRRRHRHRHQHQHHT